MLSMPLGIEHLALKSREAVQGAVQTVIDFHYSPSKNIQTLIMVAFWG